MTAGTLTGTVQSPQLSDKKQELLRLLLEERRQAREQADRPATPEKPAAGIPRRRLASPAPVSFAQQRLWFIDQLDPGTPIFNIPAGIRMAGPLVPAAFERALAHIVERHETLRTRFATVAGNPVQIIEPNAELRAPTVDLSGVAEGLRLAIVREFLTRECQRGFDLARCPLARTTLLRLGPSDHVLILILQHIVGDVWSVRVFMKELANLYQAELGGAVTALRPLQVQYADYAVWQREWLQGEVLEEQLGYWRRQLAGAPDELRLPFDRQRPPVQSIWGAKHFFQLPQALTESLRALGRQQGASAFMTLLAAWSAVLSRYTGQRDVVLGVPAANRNRSELEGLIGFFVNSLVLRTRLDGTPGFRELLARAKETTLGAFAHQDFPFERLVELLQPERDMSRNPIFQTDFILQNAPASVYEVPAMSFEPLPVENGTAQLDMTLDLWEQNGQIGGWLEYDVDLFDASTTRRMIDHLIGLLETVIRNPDLPFDRIPLLGPGERHQLLVEWNATAEELDLATLFPQRFKAQATARPQAIAALCGEEALTYGELADRAANLAGHLANLGVGTDEVVAILAPRGLDFLAGVLGILEAGAAYMPLDPQHPPGRVAQLLRQSRSSLVLTTSELEPLLSAAVIELDPGDAPRRLELPRLLAQATSTPCSIPARCHPESLAYVLFTSGSTGLPKGVMIHHRGLLNHLLANLEVLGMGAQDTLAQTASQCFDISVWQFLAPLVVGGRVHVFGDEITHDPPRLLRAVDRAAVTVFETVPSLLGTTLAEIEREGQAPALAALRWLLPTGEALPPELARRWFKLYPGIPLVNAYGPSECSDDVTFELIRREGDLDRPLAAIGRPVANLATHVFDRALRLVPVGVAGELGVGGVGVGRGYLGEPKRTAASFVPDPFAPEPGARLYKSGDLARWLPDGRLEFHGRVDHQVKVRGFRIELGEIEASLATHPAVAQAVVVVREDQTGQVRLVAYVVCDDGTPSSPQPGTADARCAELRSHLLARLPEYMVPAVFVVLPALPLTQSGKVDRKALPVPEDEGTAAMVAPRTPTEEVVVGFWMDVLGMDGAGRPLGVEDNLFERGAHSLLLTQVASRLRNTFGVELSLRSFFEDPTVAGMSRQIDRLCAGAAGVSAPPILPVPRDRPLPLSFTQERMWFLDRLQPGLTAYNVPGAVWMEGALQVRALERGLAEIVRRHEIFRTTYTSMAGRPVQVVNPHRGLSLPVVDLTALPAPTRGPLAMVHARAGARRPFDLERGPMLKVVLLRCGEREHRLALTTHHIAYDMWAREIFIEELGRLYLAFSQNQPSPLPEPAIQFADFAAWQRDWLQGEVLERQLGYWQERLQGVPHFLELPTDKPRPPVQSFVGKRQSILLDQALVAQVHGLARRLGMTPFITVLAAFQVLLMRFTGQSEIVVGSPIANRNRVELEGVMGFLANTIVLHSSLGGDPSFTALLERVRESALGAYAHQDVPFEMLVQRLQPQRDMSRSPLFQVMFNFMLHYKPPQVELPDLALTVETLHGGGAQFDLNVDMFQSADGLHGVIEYSTDVFHDTTVSRMMDQLESLLAAAVVDPTRPISSLPLLPPSQRHQVEVEWNDTAVTWPSGLDATFSQLFARQVERTPDVVAAICDDESLTYRELASRARKLAASLPGAGPDGVIALLGRRDLDLLATIVGVLESGAAYLPLDPDQPAARLAQVLEQARPRLLLASHELAALAGEAASAVPGIGPEVLLIADLLAGSTQPALETPRRDGGGQGLAYVIFTSGSTGAPKGVMVHQRGMVNHFFANLALLDMGPGDVLAQTASQCFDISVWQFLAPLLVGGRVHVFPDEVTQDPPRLLAAVDAARVTVFETVPSLLQLMLAEGQRRGAKRPRLDHLRWLLPTGEALPAELRREWQETYAHVPLVNAYGPSECSDDVTLELVPRLASGAEVVSIGRPVANLRLLVVDPALRAQGIGVPGELAIGGVGVGRGYLAEPRRTAASFVPDPFADEPGARLYRSGDLGRTLVDGRVDYLGRVDFQVKVRGFRIELGEIETVLGRHPAVRETVVVVDGPGGGDLRLVAYVVPRESRELDGQMLRAFVAERLPAYMVPALVMPLAALPLNANGKVDRAALPPPRFETVGPAKVSRLPRDVDEVALLEIFRAVLGQPDVGVEDDFFDRGGHSLLAIQVLSRIREHFGVEPPLRALFETSSVAGMVEVIRAIRWATESLGAATATDAVGAFEEEGVL